MRWTKLPLTALAVALGLAHLRYLWFVCDDAFITFRYAANLANGFGPVFNPGERVEGYTNFLWMLLSALVVKLGGQPEIVMPLFSAACALATVAAVMLWASPWAGFLLAASASFAAWGSSGLETALFTVLVTLGYLALTRGAVTWAGLALGLAALTRPEGLLLGASAGLYVALRRSRLEVPKRAAWAALGLWLLCVAPHWIWRASYYGDWLPNTFAIKTPGLASFAGGGAYLVDSVLQLHLYLLAIPIFLATARRMPHGKPAGTPEARELLAIMLAPYLAYVAFTGGDFMPLYRFVAPMLPLIAISAARGFEGLVAWSPKRSLGVALATVLVVIFVALNLQQSRHEQESWTRGYVESVGLTRENAANWARVGARLKKLSLPSDTLAISAAGIIPYVTKLHTLDLLGLTAPDLSRYRRRATTRPGHSYYLSGAALFAHPPQFLLGHPEVRPSTDHLGLTLDFEPEWQQGVLEPYALIGYRLKGDPDAFVAIAVRHDAVARVEEAGKSGP